MAIAKVIFNGTTLMDVTSATAEASDIASPKTAMLANGVVTTGTGDGTVEEKQVNFIDYDGTLVASKTKAEINAMTSDSDLPANPTHTGLTAQGWNWTVEQLKTQLTAMPDDPIWVGQMYVTTSGATEIDVEMQEGRLSPILTIAVNGTVSVDWGDNTTADTVTGTSLTTRKMVGQHNYASAGKYTIKISVTSGKFTFYGSSSYFVLTKNSTANNNKVYSNCIKSIRIGTEITNIGDSAFYNCSSLESITIPSSVTSFGKETFDNCYSIKSVTLPSGVTSIGNSAFYYCCSLKSVSIPSSVTSIGNYAFYYCYSFENITIPSGATSIGTYAFYYCHPLRSISIPNSITSIGTYAFYYCYSLKSISIPSGITSIGTYTFCYCCSLTRVTIPSGVTNIDSNAFNACYGVAEYHILPTSVPTAGSTIFSGITSDCVIYVPQDMLGDYQTASNWSTYASYMQEEST